jgi:hypothetical protein
LRPAISTWLGSLENGFDLGDNVGALGAPALLAAALGGKLPQNPLRFGEVTLGLRFVLRFLAAHCGGSARGQNFMPDGQKFNSGFFTTKTARLLQENLASLTAS